MFQSWHASRRHCAGDKRGQGEHLRGDLSGRPQQRQNHYAGAARTRDTPPSHNSRVYRLMQNALFHVSRWTE